LTTDPSMESWASQTRAAVLPRSVTASADNQDPSLMDCQNNSLKTMKDRRTIMTSSLDNHIVLGVSQNNDQSITLSTSTSNTNLSIDSMSEKKGMIEEEIKSVLNMDNNEQSISGSVIHQNVLSQQDGTSILAGRIESSMNDNNNNNCATYPVDLAFPDGSNLVEHWSDVTPPLSSQNAKADAASSNRINRNTTPPSGYSVNPFAPTSVPSLVNDDVRLMHPPIPSFGPAPPNSLYQADGSMRLQNPLGSLFPLSDVPALSIENNGFHHGNSFNDSLIPKLQIGSFNLPTYGESNERFNKVLKRKINEIGKVSINNNNTKAVGGTRSNDFTYLSNENDMVQQQQQQHNDTIYGQGDRHSKQTLSSLSASTTVSGIDMNSIPNFETPSYPQSSRDGLDTGAKTLFNLSRKMREQIGSINCDSKAVADNHFGSLSVNSSISNYIPSRTPPSGVRDDTVVVGENVMLKMCLCCPGNYHQGSTPVCVPGLPNLNGLNYDHGNTENSSLDSHREGELSAYSSRRFNLGNDLPLRLPLPGKIMGMATDIDWNEPYLELEVPETLLKQLTMFGFMSSTRILSPFELSIFRTVMCVNSQSCENARSPIKCWASHNFTKSIESRRWKRRNPFIYDYKHLMCPKIQSLKDALRARADTVDGGQKYIDKNALQQACFQCEDGINCSYSHSLEEQMYHPFVYKTAICTNQKNSNGCARPFCPFLHENEYFYDHEGNTKPRLYDSLQVWTTNKGSRRNRQFGKDGADHSDAASGIGMDNVSSTAQTPAGNCLNSSSVQELSTPNNSRTPTAVGPVIYDASYTKYPWAHLNGSIYDSFLPIIAGAPLDRDEPFKEENIDPVFARRIAQELFTNCHVPLTSLELSVFRTTRCPFKNACDNNKTPTRCWATHASDGSNRWLRRNPWLFPYKHLICPVVRKEKDCNDGKPKWHACPKGRNCNLAHSIEEQMYHPFVYKTTNCVHKNCDKPYCPFIHQGEQHRPFQTMEMIEGANSSANEAGSRRTSKAKGGKRWNKGTTNHQNRR